MRAHGVAQGGVPFTSLIAVTVVAFFSCCSETAVADFAYFDDFSTDKATEDSSFHSDFCDTIPHDSIPGTLVYVEYGAPVNRGLRLCYGTALDSWAHLQYRFPLEGDLADLVWATVSFDMILTGMESPFVWLFEASDGTPWEYLGVADETGHYEFTLTLPEGAVSARIWFKGLDVILDNLSVHLASGTPLAPSTWARIKSLYGSY